MEVYGDNDESVLDDHQMVLNRWAKDFGSLLTPPTRNTAEDAFWHQICANNAENEKIMECSPESYLNRELSESEVAKCVKRPRTGKPRLGLVDV